MRKNDLVAICVITIATSSCSEFTMDPPMSRAPISDVYGYQPLDPISVRVVPAPETARITKLDVLNALPDETMRMAVGKVDQSGGIFYGPASVSATNANYVVTVDYLKSNTVALSRSEFLGSDQLIHVQLGESSNSRDSVPVYVGVGLRLTASIRTSSSRINLGDLISIGAAAKDNKLTGTLVIQTLGITGENISTALPIPTEVSPSSIQNAILAIGTIKAKMYDNKITIQPRVVGFYKNVGGDISAVNSIISSLSTKPVTLTVPSARSHQNLEFLQQTE